jgi:hypothetical protein
MRGWGGEKMRDQMGDEMIMERWGCVDEDDDYGVEFCSVVV